ncbi:MAG: NAD(P)-dependent oxidoreductase, partial [Proteobacteria bacterium]
MNQEKENPSISRREAMGGISAGLAAIALSTLPSLAQAAGAPKEVKRAPFEPKPLEDPTTKYPRPPFSSPAQSWPALVSKMTPRPDHGETSYVGSGRLAGRKALI